MSIRYPDCTNYEGLKILVFEKGTKLEHLLNQGMIDPHFGTEGIHPIARFVPTKDGLTRAKIFCGVSP